MKKNLQIKLFFFLLLFHINTFANVDITVGTVAGLCNKSDIYKSLSTISVFETQTRDFGSITGAFMTRFEILAPLNYEFKPNSGAIALFGTDIFSENIVVSSSKIFVTIAGFNSFFSVIDWFNITGIEVKSNDNSFSNVNFIASNVVGSSIDGLTNGTILATASSVVAGNVQHWKDYFCTNGNIENIILFPPGGNLVVNYPNGNLGLPHTFNGTTLSIDPSLINSGTGIGINFTYTYANPINGCSQIYRDAIVENTLTGINYFVLGNDFTFSFTQSTGVSIFAFPTGGQFSGNGVSGNLFIPNAIAGPYPVNVPVTYTKTNPISGCKSSVTKEFTVFNPIKVFEFSPIPPLEIENPTSFTGWFCANDPEKYSITLSTSTGLQLPETSLSSVSGRSVSITAPTIANNTTLVGADFGKDFGVSFTGSVFGSVSDFRFVPSLITDESKSDFLLTYNADILTLSGRSQPFAYNVQAIQKIIMVSKTSDLILQSNPTEEFCLGEVNSSNIVSVTGLSSNCFVKWYQITGTGVNQRRLLATTAGTNISYTTLGLNVNSPTGLYKYSVSQKKIGGCESNAINFNINIKPIPSVPGLSTLIASFPNFCQDSTYSISLFPNNSTPGFSYSWYDQPVTSTGQNTFSSNFKTEPVSVNSNTGFYLTTKLNGCESNRSISTTTGSNPTVGFVPINFLPRPSLPTVVGSNVYCVGNTILPISVVGTYSFATDFRWFTSTVPGNILLTSTGVTSNNGLDYTNVFNTGFSNNNAVSITYFLKSNFVATGCKSLEFLPVNFNIYANPAVPFVLNDNGIGFTNSDFLNDSKYCFDASVNTFIGIKVLSLETNPTFLWYNSNTILGVTTTSTSYVTNSSKNVSNAETIYLSQKINGCESKLKKIIIEITPQPAPPTITGFSEFNCTGTQLQDLVSSSTISGASIRWYSSVSGVLQAVGVPNIGSNIFNPLNSNIITNNTTGSYIFASDLINPSGCRSPLTTVTIEYRQTPDKAKVFDKVFCAGNAVIGNLKAETPISSLSGQFLEWYYQPSNITTVGTNTIINGGTVFQSEIDGSFLGSNFSENDTFFPIFIKNNLYGCQSDLAELRVYIRKNPLIPIRKASYNKFNCVGAELPIISASLGQENLKWYLTTPGIGIFPFATGTTIETKDVITAVSAPVWNNNFETAPHPQIYLFYNTQTSNKGFLANNITFSGCESQPRIDSVLYFPNPPSPILPLSTEICVGQSNQTITVTGATNTLAGFTPNSSFKWHLNSVTGNTVSLTETYTTSISTLKDTVLTFWVSQSNYNRSGFSCQSPRGSTNYVIKPLPKIDILNTKANFSYCNSDLPSTITGLPMGGFYSSTFGGINTISGNKLKLDPNQTFVGNSLKSTITYSFTSISGCSNSLTKEFQINLKPTGLSMIFENLQINSLPGFCANPNNTKDLIVKTDQSAQNLGTDYITVKYNNSNVVSLITNKKFNPANIFATARQLGSDMETVTVTYKYIINGSGCVDSISTTKELYAHPNLTFEEDENCEKIEINIQSSITGINLINSLKYKWTGASLSNFVNTTLPDLRGTFTPGPKNIRLTVSTKDGCTNQLTKLINIGANPEAKFIFKNICENDITEIVDSSKIANGKIVHRSINFGDGSAWDVAQNELQGLGNSSTVMHKFQNASTNYTTVMTVTSDLGCSSIFSNNIYILPTYLIANTGLYDANFGSEIGWFSESLLKTDTTNHWKLKVPSKNNLNSAVGRVWYIDNAKNNPNTYAIGQSSALNSPCFDFSNYNKPMVSFDNFIDTREGADGVIFQYSINGGQSWNDLGFINSGITWYNSLNILGNPGNSPQGWSKKLDAITQKKWLKSSHTLDEVRNQKSVRFRFAFASANQSFSSGETAEGFAVNNFRINKRTKITLIEQFVNENSNESKIACRGNNSIGLRGIDNIVKDSPDNIVAIKYHTSFPSDDRFNLENPSDPSVRILYNSVNEVPKTILDGNVFIGSTFSKNDAFMEDNLKKVALLQTLTPPDFDIELSLNNDLILITVTSNLTYPANEDTLLVLNVAQIERSVTFTGFNGQTEFESVLKRFIPSASGTILEEPMTKTQKKVFSFGFDPNLVKTTNMLGFVVFLQNSISKHISQSAYIGPRFENISSINKSDNEENNVAIYPNPAQNIVYIHSDNQKITKVELTNILGNSIETPILKLDNERYTINTEKIANGLYFVSIYFENKTLFKNKIVIFK